MVGVRKGFSLRNCQLHSAWVGKSPPLLKDSYAKRIKKLYKMFVLCASW